MDRQKKLFPQRLWELVNDPRYDNCLRWSSDGHKVYLNRNDFEQQYLSSAHNQFHTQKAISFVRQMNMYGFRKVDESYYENDHFKRDYPHLLKNMVRRNSNRNSISSQSSAAHHSHPQPHNNHMQINNHITHHQQSQSSQHLDSLPSLTMQQQQQQQQQSSPSSQPDSPTLCLSICNPNINSFNMQLAAAAAAAAATTTTTTTQQHMSPTTTSPIKQNIMHEQHRLQNKQQHQRLSLNDNEPNHLSNNNINSFLASLHEQQVLALANNSNNSASPVDNNARIQHHQALPLGHTTANEAFARALSAHANSSLQMALMQNQMPQNQMAFMEMLRNQLALENAVKSINLHQQQQFQLQQQPLQQQQHQSQQQQQQQLTQQQFQSMNQHLLSESPNWAQLFANPTDPSSLLLTASLSAALAALSQATTTS